MAAPAPSLAGGIPWLSGTVRGSGSIMRPLEEQPSVPVKVPVRVRRRRPGAHPLRLPPKR